MKDNTMNYYFEYLDTFFSLERFEFPEMTFLTMKEPTTKIPTYNQWEKRYVQASQTK